MASFSRPYCVNCMLDTLAPVQSKFYSHLVVFKCIFRIRPRKKPWTHFWWFLCISLITGKQWCMHWLGVGRHCLKPMMTSLNGNIFALLTLCKGNSLVTGEFPSKRPVTWSFDVLSSAPEKTPRRRWYETPSRSLRPYCNEWCQS